MNKKLIIAFAVFSLIGVGLFYMLTTGPVGEQYNTVEVIKGEVGQYVQDVGRISSRNIRKYYGNGVRTVESMTLKLGDHVKKGQLLIKYEDKLDLEIRKVEKQIKALEATYNEALSGSDMASVNSARIEVSKIKNDLNMAKKNKERTEELYNSGAVSLMEFEQATNNMEQLQSSLGIAQNTYNRLTKELSENLKGKHEADIGVLLLTLDMLEKNQKDYVIYSDVEGIVTELTTFEGDTPTIGSLVLEIQDPTEKVVLVDFMTEDARRIEPNMEAEVQDMKLDIHIENLKVNRVYPKAFITLSELSVEENRQTVEIGLPKNAEDLVYGLEVDMKVMIEASRQAILIPTGAVIQKDLKEYVEVLVGGNLVEREITTGIKVNNRIEVIEGLTEGEQVILNYQEE